MQIESHNVYINSEKVFGVIEKMGAFASLVVYEKNGIQYEELLENEDFSIVDEVVFHHVEEEN